MPSADVTSLMLLMPHKVVAVPVEFSNNGRIFTTPVVSLNDPLGVLFTDFVKRLENDRCFHE